MRPQQGVQGDRNLCTLIFIRLCSQTWLPSTIFALWSSLVVLKNMTSATIFTLWSSLAVLTNLTSAIKRHLDFILLCSQIWLPLQSLHCDLFFCVYTWFVALTFCSRPNTLCNTLLIDFFLFLKHSNNKKCLYFVHCFFSIFISHQAHEKILLITWNKDE